MLGPRVNEIQSANLKMQLETLFGQRFSPGTRRQVGTVSPRNVAEVRRIIRCSREFGVPITPPDTVLTGFRVAKAPPGIAITFEHMDRILELDEQAQLARIQPGVEWPELLDRLRTHSLMPRVCPCSWTSPKVGGAVTQGGAGVGSYQYGGIRDCIASARVIAGDGGIIELRGDALDQGIRSGDTTAILLELVLRLQPLATMEPLVAVFNRMDELASCLDEIGRGTLPLWSVTMMDRTAVDLQSKLSSDLLGLSHGRYAALFGFRQSDRKRVLPRLRGSILAVGGKLLAVKGSHKTWSARVIGLRTLGATPISVQFQAPVSTLAKFVQGIPLDLRRRLAFEGIMADGGRSMAVRFFLPEVSDAADHSQQQAARDLGDLATRLGVDMYATERRGL
jgi:FAD/FMN-containing dehydrogenase